MRGITPVVAVVLLLIISVAIVGAAYAFVVGLFPHFTYYVIFIGATSCPQDIAHVVFRNMGEKEIWISEYDEAAEGYYCDPYPVVGDEISCIDFDLVKVAGGGTFQPFFDKDVVDPGESGIFKDYGCVGTCTYHVSIGATLREATVKC